MLGRFWEGLKAQRRGERRIAPYGSRGRVFEKRNPEAESSALSGKNISAGPKLTVTAKITRADGSVEIRNLSGTATKL